MTLDSFSDRHHGRAVFATMTSDDRAAIGTVRDDLRAAGYDEAGVRALLGMPVLDLHPAAFHHLDKHVLGADPLAAAIRLFLLDRAVDEQAVRALLSEPSLDVLLSLGVLDEADGGFRSQVHITCVNDLLLATDTGRYSDWWTGADDLSDRVMYIGYDSAGLANVAPRSRAKRTLDLCSGSGIQSLVASGYSDEVVGVDINPRAIRFARFNAALNGIENTTFVLGDLHEPVSDREFDRIVSNPPFVPEVPEGAHLLYRDGGPDGERLLAQIVSGARQVLAPGGLMSITTDLFNLEDLPRRIGEWLGAKDGFDVLVLVERQFRVWAYADTHASHAPTTRERTEYAARMVDALGDAGISTVHTGYIVVRRQPGGGPRPGTVQTVSIAGPVTRPTGSHVVDHFRFLDRDLDGHTDGILRPNPAVHLVSSAPPGGPETHQLVAPQDDYVADMDISDLTRKLWQATASSDVHWGVIRGSALESVARELVRQGALTLGDLPPAGGSRDD
ncbi:methyltransferase [Streptomyces sp. NBC_01500]|uniref:methyltransferase n=1 Tax=Streptomyces sp. NBC_01500 TaxID=2903886 RepID=UPI0022556A53|nr:methyltransferase [Streptomyces sp. NBC_01500]MCX4547650.1 methyltransferase [Streptomyces sp. NBC_01500]